MKRLAIAASAAALTLAINAQAFEVYTDYTFSKEVWNVTMVKVNPNRIDDSLLSVKLIRRYIIDYVTFTKRGGADKKTCLFFT